MNHLRALQTTFTVVVLGPIISGNASFFMQANGILVLALSSVLFYLFLRGLGNRYLLWDLLLVAYYLGTGMVGWKMIMSIGVLMSNYLISEHSFAFETANTFAWLLSMIVVFFYLMFVGMLGEKIMMRWTRNGLVKLFKIDIDT